MNVSDIQDRCMPVCKSEGVCSLACSASAARLCHAQGLCLDLKNLRMSPKLLARLASSVAGKQDVRKVVGQLLPDLCQVRAPSCCLASLSCFTGVPLQLGAGRGHRHQMLSHMRKLNSKCSAEMG